MNKNKKGNSKSPFQQNNTTTNDFDLENLEFNIDNNQNINTQETIESTEDNIDDFDNTLDEQDELEEDEFLLEENSDDFDKSEDLTLEEEINEFKNLPIKMQSTTSFNNQDNPNSQESPQDDDYDFDKNPDENSDYELETNNNQNLTQEFDNPNSKTSPFPIDDDYDFDEDPSQEETIEYNEPEETSNKIAHLIHKESKEKPKLKTPRTSTKTPKNPISLSDRLILHKTKIILTAILIIIIGIWLILSQIGITTHTIPKFKNTIKIIKANKIQTQYTLREKSIFHKSEIDLTLNDTQTLKIQGQTSLSSEIFSILQHNLKNATISILESKIHLINNESTHNPINIINILSELTSEKFLQSFKKLSIENSHLLTQTSEGKSDNNILIKNLIIEKINDTTTINSKIATNNKQIELNYSYFSKTKKFTTITKSSSFNISCSGSKKIFGTASKDAQLKGNCEIIIKNLSEFMQIFNINNTIIQNTKNLPQITLQFVFEYSSLNNEVKISQGKINILNSLGRFEITTTPESYQGNITFETISITDIISIIKDLLNNTSPKSSPKTTQESPQTNEKITTNKNHTLNIFSIITPTKPIELQIFSKNLTSKSKILFDTFQSNLIITTNQININETKITNSDSTIKLNGQISQIQNNPISYFEINLEHQNNDQTNSSNIAKTLIEKTSGIQMIKNFIDTKTQIDISILYKGPSRTINTTIEIPQNLSMEVNSQNTQNSPPHSSLQLKNITISNTNLDNLSFNKIFFQKGDTLFGKFATMGETTTEKHLNIINSQYKDTLITKANLNLTTQKDSILIDLDITSDSFNVNNKTIINTENSSQKVSSNTILENIKSFSNFHKILQGFFEKNSITIPSFEKFDGNINLILIKHIMFNKLFDRIEIMGNLNQGVLELKETKISSTQNTTNEKPLTSKMAGTIDLRRQIPSFALELIATNISVESFKSLLPFETNIQGNLYGGGSFEFTGTNYNEILSTLKTKSKFVIQEAQFSRLNLDFIGKHLTKYHKVTSELDSDYIQKNFENNSNTKANIIFSLNGSDKKLTIENCEIKTGYSNGSCYGSVDIVNESANIEILAKFAVPALDINNSLKDIMKLYISTKIKTNGEKCEITNDFSQINQYTSYRKATFAL